MARVRAAWRRRVGVRILGGVVFGLVSAAPAGAQGPPPSSPPEAPGIQDNSFLIEEAYNQELGVVQHISSFVRSFEGEGWLYSFTQEWPVAGLTHQLSYTLLVAEVGAGNRGLGDLALNYRYQLAGNGEAKLACSPRFSVLFPTGSARKGLGVGGLGLQVGVPLSLVLGKHLVSHTNAGFTHVFSARDAPGDRAGISTFTLGASLIWLASSRFNVLTETVWTRAQSVTGPGERTSSDFWLVSPGIRWAHNFRSGLQIVPGLAFPLGVGPSHGEKSILLYLSFEHPFGKRR
jgi:hypothetical protein